MTWANVVQEIEAMNQQPTFEQELERLINAHSIENESDTPDFILVKAVRGFLNTWKEAVTLRDRWYGHQTMRHRRQPLGKAQVGDAGE